MNLWFRLFWYLVSLPWRAALRLPEDVSKLRFRVLPLDFDTSLHLNNGRYLALMDLGRFDLIASGGLLRSAIKHRWTPIANSVVIRFRQELRFWALFELRTRIIAWRDRDVVIEQVFVALSGKRAGQVAARALFVGGLYDRGTKSFVEISRLMQEIGVTRESPRMPDEAKDFLASVDSLRAADRVSS